MLGEIFRSFKKSNRIKRLSKEYLKYSINSSTTGFEALSQERLEKKSKVLDEVIDMAFNEPNNQPVIKKFGLDKKKLEEIVQELEFNGAGQYLGGHYISISAILYPQTLEFIVYKKREKDLEKMRMMLRLMDYFKNGETGNIVDIEY
jgi:hypothetical protein